MNRNLFLLTIGIYSCIAGLIALSSFILKEKSVEASMYPLVVEANTAITFTDSTAGVKTILWEFGNGEHSEKHSGTYIYKTPGKYKARVTINKTSRQTFLIDVQAKKTVLKIDSSVFIHANRSGITGQKVHFKVIGTGIKWCEWYFSGLGSIESRNIETFHAFNKAGTYEVLLLTNLNPRVPTRHKIIIEPAYKITENTVLKPAEPAGGGKKEANKASAFQTTLQKMAYGKDFNTNYSMLLTNYLCSNPKTPVLINGTKTADFYSFCQGLQLNGNILIKKAVIELNGGTGCATRVVVEY